MGIPSFSLEGKVAIVTGSKTGIGKAIALGFAQAGADVVVCSRVVEGGALEAVAEEIRKLGRRSLAIQTDVRRKTDVDNLVQKTMDEFGIIDILVNNAGVMPIAPLLEYSEEDWDSVIDTDLKGYFLCSQAVGKRMVEQKKGNIINISSIRAVRPRANIGAYCVAKAGEVMLTKALALELASYNIRVNSLASSMVETKMTKPLLAIPGILERLIPQIPMGHIAEATDMVGTAIFLASDASSYITGQTIFVDGGQLI